MRKKYVRKKAGRMCVAWAGSPGSQHRAARQKGTLHGRAD
jgi:hypothetical protein